MNLDAYLERIGYDGPVAPTTDALQAIAFKHATTIPFENLAPFLGLSVDLSPDALERKLVSQRRGGYCFEHNLLLWQALTAIGFDVSGLAARVLWNGPDDRITPRSHMLLRIAGEEGALLVDVGFGGMTPTGVLALRADVEQSTPHEPFRLIQRDGDWWMQAKVGEGWPTLYRFDLQRQHPVDYEAPNHYLSTNPVSHFTSGLTVARPVPGGRHALRNRELAFHPLDGASERRTLRDVDEMLDVLDGTFGIEPPDVPQLRPRLATLFTG
ncbi:arylamine N-acetyltransferase [Lysobacter sp. LF1]|uniref:Arylamine N-acetyltransferase n=1 Tax=Lysobacter stagni TaxID=3045172 RepID=A0ABT6XIV7_9GAMM|nr:arylamine N-acetyltransferase [Lysobacter sp. LF1]MDI9240004.1 arylamine N-acetyltransferase [Lysobacter sp. LF1]